MDKQKLIDKTFEQISDLPLLDAHTHLIGGKMGAQGLHDIILYHMAVSDLYAAGCPNGRRLTQYPGWPTTEEAHSRIKEALPYLSKTGNTAIAWATRIILRDLYNWKEPITADNWMRLDEKIRERSNDKRWQREIARRANIQKFVTEYARREDGQDDDVFYYALEWVFFTRYQWKEYDTALYELERCWGCNPESPTPIGTGPRPATKRHISSVGDVDAAIDHMMRVIPFNEIIAYATHISTDLDLREISEEEMTKALTKRPVAGPVERDIYASYINEKFLTALEKHGNGIVFQFSFGAEPLPYETGSRLSQNSIAQLAAIISRHPEIKFQCFLSSRHANQSLCTLCRELPNLSLTGYWWHNFFPVIIRDVMSERLDMLPINKQVGFFSDAYCLEWSYAKSVIVLRELAEVLAGKVQSGQYSRKDALEIAGDMLYETPKSLLGLKEKDKN